MACLRYVVINKLRNSNNNNNNRSSRCDSVLESSGTHK